MPQLSGKIIRIVDERTVLVNLGSKDRITPASFFTVYGGPEQITDPDTGENLGSLSIAKARLKASRVFEKFTVATTKWIETVVPSSMRMGNIVDFFGYKTREHDEGPLNVDPKDIKPWKARTEEPIRVGDTVVTEVPQPEPESDKADSEEPPASSEQPESTDADAESPT